MSSAWSRRSVESPRGRRPAPVVTVVVAGM
jgi:hypothetical protein